MSQSKQALTFGGFNVSRGINWTWVHFNLKSDAQRFIDWLNSTNGEHRGIYVDDWLNDPDGPCAVRYR